MTDENELAKDIEAVVGPNDNSALDCIPNIMVEIGSALEEASAAITPAPEPPKPTGFMSKFTDKMPSVPNALKTMPTIAIPNVKTNIQPRSG